MFPLPLSSKDILKNIFETKVLMSLFRSCTEMWDPWRNFSQNNLSSLMMDSQNKNSVFKSSVCLNKNVFNINTSYKLLTRAFKALQHQPPFLPFQSYIPKISQLVPFMPTKLDFLPFFLFLPALFFYSSILPVSSVLPMSTTSKIESDLFNS